ncbi:HAMP domain-containing histidine kinase [Sphingomonas piscis]|uniref:histidine kinase n=1 Tax=Sphingomonas piscis TaxID=2714943 RepID=A0A6G7YSQ1_9SPHN|nr:HAMP domain-containing sensor histidine kinase [Sphingomonas piscis]QIK79767.1 HAMP domain-containing histidine kinase [Sphingomonas piscis]
MATAPPDPDLITGRLDSSDRLIEADPPLRRLQEEAGGSLGTRVCVPQLASLAEVARRLQTALVRPVQAATSDNDVDLLVRLTPEGSDLLIAVESWTERPAKPSRLAAMAGARLDTMLDTGMTWSVNDRLELVDVSRELAEHLESRPDRLVGLPITKLLKLEENEDGELPLLAALASRNAFRDQHARVRGGSGARLTLSGDIVRDGTGQFAGLAGEAFVEKASVVAPPIEFDRIFDEALRSPLDQIIAEAEKIVGEADGPIQPDYAAYGADIATAARHLLSVIASMSPQGSAPDDVFNLAEAAEEAVLLLEATAQERRIAVQLQARRRLPAQGDRRAVIQILVNLIGNAIRHSPDRGHIDLYFTRSDGQVSVAVEDQGPGVPEGDEERIFGRFERAHDEGSNTGLGLAIARRLARSMGGDVTLETKATPGARFSLSLPEAR